MRFLSFIWLSIAFLFLAAGNSFAQEDIIKAINDYGTFDRWSSREVKESNLIGGQKKKLYEFYGDYTNKFTGDTPYTSPEDYLWRTNNVLAVVLGIVKTNNTVFPEKRGDGYCARIETHIEKVKVLGTINMDVVCQGAIMIGKLPEPITTTKDPMSKVLYGLPFNGCPKAVEFDYKADVGNEVIKGTGFCKLQAQGYNDVAEVTFMLLKMWEEEDGSIHALRVATGIERICEDAPEWINGHRINIHYGDITSEPFYRDYMGLKTDPKTAYRAKNSKGNVVIIQEEGWAPVGTQPNHMMLHFITSCGEAFYGGVGNTLWLDNVKIIM
mgnify:FL=1